MAISRLSPILEVLHTVAFWYLYTTKSKSWKERV